MDFEQTEHKYLFFNLENGLLVDYTDLFDEKEMHRALKEINRQARDLDGADGCQAELGGSEEDLDWSSFHFRLYKDGLEVSHVSETCSIAFPIPWPLLNSYLKFRFL